MRTRRENAQRGQITAFAVGVCVALLLLAGLALDGGRILSAREKALDEAQEAARTAAEQLDPASLRTGSGAVVDPVAAQRAADQYLAATGDTGVVVVRGADVQVTVRRDVSMDILSLGGLSNVTVSESGTAHASRGTVAGT